MKTLFAAKGTVAFAVHVALEETNAVYDVTWINFADGDQLKPDYLAINPKRRVPALVTPDGVLTETPALLEYIAETRGALMPDDIMARARVRELMAYLAATMHVNHAHGVRGARWADAPASFEDMAAKVPQTMAESCAYLEGQLPDGGWITQDFSIADIHLYTVCRWLTGDGVDITAYPKLAAHFAATAARDAVMRVEAAHA